MTLVYGQIRDKLSGEALYSCEPNYLHKPKLGMEIEIPHSKWGRVFGY